MLLFGVYTLLCFCFYVGVFVVYKGFVDGLSFFADHELVVPLVDGFDSEMFRLRFHVGFRNRSLRVRGEAAFVQSWFLVRGLGFKGSVADLRKVFLSSSGGYVGDDLLLDLFFRFYRANVFVNGLMPDLQRSASTCRQVDFSFKYLASRVHSFVGLHELVGVPRGSVEPLSFHLSPVVFGDVLLERLEFLGSLFDCGRFSHVCAAVFFAEFLVASPFVDFNFEVAVILSRLFLCRSGVDPTGCLVFGDGFSPSSRGFVEALNGYSSGSVDGVLGWVCFFLNSLSDGLGLVEGMAESVLAGLLSDWD